MQLHLLLEKLVTEGERFDITPVSEAVFEKASGVSGCVKMS